MAALSGAINTCTCTCLVNVFFEGTAQTLNYETQVGLFYHIVEGVALNNKNKQKCLVRNYGTVSEYEEALQKGRLDFRSDIGTSSNHKYKIGFDGCGVTNGTTGMLFATGLRGQCSQVRGYLQSLMQSSATGYEKINVNCVGSSRGGIAGLYLAQELAPFKDAVELNLLLLDPVPGNGITSSSWIDMFSFSTANAAMDIKSCNNIKSVFVQYPYIPLPDIAFHAPLLPTYPQHLKAENNTLEEDSCLGCHIGAIQLRGLESALSYVRLKDWLGKHGATFSNLRSAQVSGICQSLEYSIISCVKEMDAALIELSNNEYVERLAHSYPSGGKIVKNRSGRYLNKHHELLVKTLREQWRETDASSAVPCRISNAFDSSPHPYLLEVIRIPESKSMLISITGSISISRNEDSNE